MLPSRGFFKKNDCPFFESGLCERPHCHFRHRKKVSENSDSLDCDDLVISETISGISIIDSIREDRTKLESKNSSPNNDEQHSSSYSNLNNDQKQSSSDSLFAKLVNQPNSYEKISRHIPCAYTPTPQIKGAQPKYKSNSSNVNSKCSNAVEIFPKTQNYNIVSSEKNINTHVNQKSNSEEGKSSSTLISFESQYLKESKNNTLSTTSVGYNISDVSIDESDSVSYYEPQSTTKSINSDINIKGSESSYVPSKVTVSESKYIPGSNDISLLNEYVPSKDKVQQSQYVPEGSGSNKNEITYTPSDKSSVKETQYQPENSTMVVDYFPTDKSTTKASGKPLLSSGKKSEWNEFDFISSEIEMMKSLLKENDKEESTENSDTNLKTDKSHMEKNGQSSEKEKSSSKSHRSSKSSHRSNSSSHSHSRSKSKHSDSSSSKHSSSKSSSSSRHHSSSSKHHTSSSRHHSSSGRNKSSSDRHKSSSSHRRSSSEHKKKSSKSSSPKSSERGDNVESHKKAKDKSSREKESSDGEKKKKKYDVITIESDCDYNNVFDDADIQRMEEGSETGSEKESNKRKNMWDDDGGFKKILKKSDDEFFDDFDEDPEIVEQECLEIFNNYSKSKNPDTASKTNEIVIIPGDESDNALPGKKRTAHATTFMADHSVLRQKSVKKPNSMKSAQETMLERYKIVEKAKESAAPTPVVNQSASIAGLNRSSVRIAAVSNIQQMLKAKQELQEKINRGLKASEKPTVAQTVSQGGVRVAHTPTLKNTVDRPIITIGSKQIPQFKRQIYLDKLLIETNQIYPTKEESVKEAMRLEEEAYRAHSGSFSAYHAAFVSTLMRTRRRLLAVKGETSSMSKKPKMSHQEVLSGGKKNFSVLKTKKVDISMLSDRHIYEELLRCKLTAEELKLNSFPLEGSKPGYAVCLFNFELKYNNKYLHIKKLTGNRRYCVRCSKQYEVDPVTLKQYKEGPETCSYHPGKKKSGGRNTERIYNCCNTSSSEGCATHIRHVTDCNNYDNLPNCVKTLSKDDVTNPGVFALDCEMVYTRLGYELARVTVVNLKKEVVYDTLVKPKYPIECYNTFYSGIEEKMMEGVETSLKDVQAVLLSMFSDKTILIGHSLDSDLRALHLIHDTVVDTAVFYKNEKYFPYKYSLKDLCAKKISKIIQENVGGHDSAEDATAALEIMLNHVKEEVSKYDSLESYEADRMK